MVRLSEKIAKTLEIPHVSNFFVIPSILYSTPLRKEIAAFKERLIKYSDGDDEIEKMIEFLEITEGKVVEMDNNVSTLKVEIDTLRNVIAALIDTRKIDVSDIRKVLDETWTNTDLHEKRLEKLKPIDREVKIKKLLKEKGEF